MFRCDCHGKWSDYFLKKKFFFRCGWLLACYETDWECSCVTWHCSREYLLWKSALFLFAFAWDYCIPSGSCLMGRGMGWRSSQGSLCVRNLTLRKECLQGQAAKLSCQKGKDPLTSLLVFWHEAFHAVSVSWATFSHCSYLTACWFWIACALEYMEKCGESRRWYCCLYYCCWPNVNSEPSHVLNTSFPHPVPFWKQSIRYNDAGGECLPVTLFKKCKVRRGNDPFHIQYCIY